MYGQLSLEPVAMHAVWSEHYGGLYLPLDSLVAERVYRQLGLAGTHVPEQRTTRQVGADLELPQLMKVRGRLEVCPYEGLGGQRPTAWAATYPLCGP